MPSWNVSLDTKLYPTVSCIHVNYALSKDSKPRSVKKICPLMPILWPNHAKSQGFIACLKAFGEVTTPLTRTVLLRYKNQNIPLLSADKWLAEMFFAAWSGTKLGKNLIIVDYVEGTKFAPLSEEIENSLRTYLRVIMKPAKDNLINADYIAKLNESLSKLTENYLSSKRKKITKALPLYNDYPPNGCTITAQESHFIVNIPENHFSVKSGVIISKQIPVPSKMVANKLIKLINESSIKTNPFTMSLEIRVENGSSEQSKKELALVSGSDPIMDLISDAWSGTPFGYNLVKSYNSGDTTNKLKGVKMWETEELIVKGLYRHSQCRVSSSIL